MISVEDLRKMKAEALLQLTVREHQPEGRLTISCSDAAMTDGSRELVLATMEELEDCKLHHLQVAQSGMLGNSDQEPLVDVAIKGSQVYTYGAVDIEKMKQIIAQHVVKGQPIYDWVVGVKETN